MRLSIGELARRTGHSASALRYYEQRGLLPVPARISKRRVYDASAIARVRIIDAARSAGFTLAEVRRFVSEADNTPGLDTPARRWRAIAAAKARELDAQMRRLRGMRRALDTSFQCECRSLEDCERRILK